MSKSLTIINIIWTIADTLVCSLSIAACAWLAVSFQKWWIFLFAVVPLAVFSRHALLVDSVLNSSEGGENNSET